MATAKKAAKTVASKTPATARAAMSDATLLLTRDHAEVKKLFKQYEKLADAEADGEERQALAEQICAMLTVHATVEEEIFYPAAREAEVDSDLLDEAEVEHASAKDLIAQIQGMGARRRALRRQGHGAGRVHRPSRAGRGRRDVPEVPQGRDGPRRSGASSSRSARRN